MGSIFHFAYFILTVIYNLIMYKTVYQNIF